MNETETPERLAQQGKERYEQAEYLEAAGLFDQARLGFQAAGSAQSAAEMANNRSVALLQAGEAQAALDAVGDSPEQFAAAGDARRQAMALGNRAAALAALDRKGEAEQTYWESARLLGELGETDLRASVLQSISRLQLRGGRYMEALASMDAGLETVQKPSLTQRLLKRLVRIPKNLINKK